MLSVMAAVLPIVGSLLVALSVILEQARLRAERRVRVRVDRLVSEREARLTDRYSAGRINYDAVTRDVTELRNLLLRHNGLAPTGLTRGDVRIGYAMSGPLLPKSEVARQWTLLLSAASGVVLLAADLATKHG